MSNFDQCLVSSSSSFIIHHHSFKQLTSATPLRQLAGGCSHQFTGLPSGAGSNLSFEGFCITHLCCCGHLQGSDVTWRWSDKRRILQILFFAFFHLFPFQNHEAGDLSSTMLWDTLLWCLCASVPFQTFIAAPNWEEVVLLGTHPTTSNCCL